MTKNKIKLPTPQKPARIIFKSGSKTFIRYVIFLLNSLKIQKSLRFSRRGTTKFDYASELFVYSAWFLMSAIVGVDDIRISVLSDVNEW